MRVLHIGVGSSSERNADLFFRDLLGLAKAEPYGLPVELSRSIFAIDRELTISNYAAEGMRYEVFVDPLYRAPVPSVLHSCLEVDDLAGFLARCGAAGVKVKRTPRGDSFVTFISDLDGNLFEVKGKQ
jgi:catechol 2,3-dioxygenase-like lactoylglutathione lyase family enzyme